MKLRKPTGRQSIHTFAALVALGLIGWLMYWLLPVAVQSRLSADHVRYVFGNGDLDPVAGNSLSSLWTLCLLALRELGLGVGHETFATAAALSGWMSLAAFAVLMFVVPAPAMILLVLTPAVLWTAVVPNGVAIQFLLLALMAVFSNPRVTFANDRKRWCVGAVINGLACALSPAAWLLVILRAAHSKYERSSAAMRIRLILFVVGFSLPAAFTALMGVSTFASIPIWTSFRALRLEDGLGAGAVFFGGAGESSIALAATLAVAIAISLGTAWKSATSPRVVTSAKWAFLILPFLLLVTFGHPKAWRLAHPGWNTVIEDFALNVDRSFSSNAVALVRSSTEEAAIRYADALLAKKPHIVALRPINLFEASTVDRVHAREPHFSVDEASKATDASGFPAFVEFLIVPNTKRGVRFWLDAIPDRNTDLEVRFLGNGLGVRSTEGPTKFLIEREDLKSSYVRAHVGYKEFEAGPSIESEIFSRYAVYHLAAAKIISKEKRTGDWEQRARAEHYAALKKVEWLHDSYQKVCVEPAEKTKADAARGNVEAKKSEPLDVCVETKEFHETNKNWPTTLR